MQMLSPTLGDGVGEFGKTSPSHQVHIFYLEVARRPRRVFQQEVDARAVAVFHLAADRRVSRKLRDRARRDRFARQRIGMRGIDADELEAAAEIDLDELPAMHKLALEVGRLRQPHSRALRVQPDHRARIGAMHRDGLARWQDDVGEEALVALDEGGRNERGREAHAWSLHWFSYL